MTHEDNKVIICNYFPRAIIKKLIWVFVHIPHIMDASSAVQGTRYRRVVQLVLYSSIRVSVREGLDRIAVAVKPFARTLC